MKRKYAVYAMGKDNEPIHRQSIITTFHSASIIKGLFWQNGQTYYESLGYSLAVCYVSDCGEPILYGGSYEIKKEIPNY